MSRAVSKFYGEAFSDRFIVEKIDTEPRRKAVRRTMSTCTINDWDEVMRGSIYAIVDSCIHAIENDSD